MGDFERRDLVTTREAAAVLGVGTTSIKRWADSGHLPCVRTAGGHRRFSRSAVLEFRRFAAEFATGDANLVDPAWVGDWIARLVEDQGVGDVEAALTRERELLGAWAAVADALGAVLDELGRRWAAGNLSVIDEHIASARLSRAAAALARGTRDPGGPWAVLVSAQSDEHCLGLSLCELVLCEARWRSVWLGARAPTAELCDFISTKRPQLVVMSASVYSTDGAALAGQAERIGEACRGAGASLVLGGRGHWPEALTHGYRLYRFGELAAMLARAAA